MRQHQKSWSFLILPSTGLVTPPPDILVLSIKIAHNILNKMFRNSPFCYFVSFLIALLAINRLYQ